jgi:hypothetical protein
MGLCRARAWLTWICGRELEHEKRPPIGNPLNALSLHVNSGTRERVRACCVFSSSFSPLSSQVQGPEHENRGKTIEKKASVVERGVSSAVDLGPTVTVLYAFFVQP